MEVAPLSLPNTLEVGIFFFLSSGVSSAYEFRSSRWYFGRKKIWHFLTDNFIARPHFSSQAPQLGDQFVNPWFTSFTYFDSAFILTNCAQICISIFSLKFWMKRSNWECTLLSRLPYIDGGWQKNRCRTHRAGFHNISFWPLSTLYHCCSETEQRIFTIKKLS